MSSEHVQNNFAEQLKCLESSLTAAKYFGFQYATTASIAFEQENVMQFRFQNTRDRRVGQRSTLSTLGQLGVIDLEVFRSEPAHAHAHAPVPSAPLPPRPTHPSSRPTSLPGPSGPLGNVTGSDSSWARNAPAPAAYGGSHVSRGPVTGPVHMLPHSHKISAPPVSNPSWDDIDDEALLAIDIDLVSSHSGSQMSQHTHGHCQNYNGHNQSIAAIEQKIDTLKSDLKSISEIINIYIENGRLRVAGTKFSGFDVDRLKQRREAAERDLVSSRDELRLLASAAPPLQQAQASYSNNSAANGLSSAGHVAAGGAYNSYSNINSGGAYSGR